MRIPNHILVIFISVFTMVVFSILALAEQPGGRQGTVTTLDQKTVSGKITWPPDTRICGVPMSEVKKAELKPFRLVAKKDAPGIYRFTNEIYFETTKGALRRCFGGAAVEITVTEDSVERKLIFSPTLEFPVDQKIAKKKLGANWLDAAELKFQKGEYQTLTLIANPAPDLGKQVSVISFE